MKELLDQLRDGDVERAKGALEDYLTRAPTPEALSLLLIELLDLDESPPYRKPDRAQQLRFLVADIAARHPSLDAEIEWALVLLQFRLGLVEATQVACGVLLGFLRRAPDHLAAHHLYLEAVIEHEFFIDLGYADRVDELSCTPEQKADVLRHWAQAEHASFLNCTDGSEAQRVRSASRVAELLRRAHALDGGT